VRDFLRSADLNFGNLESPFSTRDRATPHGSMIFNAPPPGVQGLEDYGFRVVSLANNHAFDQGADGLAYTLQHLHEHHIQTVGAGHSLAEAWQPALFDLRGTKVAFLAASYASINDNGSATNPYLARIADVPRLTAAVSTLKSQNAFVIVSMHAGAEYTAQPNARQIAFAHAAIDAGAGVVVGHHPHWTQSIERYKGALIFYSLGNFVFDQGQSKDTREGLAVKLHLLQGRLLSADLHPIQIERYCCPRLAPGADPIHVLP
jgi:poly-gamma-glutamate synthesis protein (capsule biosynthesis protein)